MPAGPGKEAVVAELKAKEAMVSTKKKALRHDTINDLIPIQQPCA